MSEKLKSLIEKIAPTVEEYFNISYGLEMEIFKAQQELYNSAQTKQKFEALLFSRQACAKMGQKPQTINNYRKRFKEGRMLEATMLKWLEKVNN